MLLKCSPKRCLEFKKFFHRTASIRLNEKQVEEVKIPVPWGHIAGRWWGSKQNEPIIAVHGWQDNAGTWDPMLKALEGNLSVLAIDLPGGGFSSHLPPFHNYSFLDSLTVIRCLQKYFKLDRITYLGHSGGSATGFLFSTVFPDSVKCMFGIDFLLYAYKHEDKRADRMSAIVDKKVDLGLRDSSLNKSYTWEEAREAWVKGTRGSVSPKSADILMKRGVDKLSNGEVHFNRDHRLKSRALESISVSQALKLATNVKTSISLIKASKSPFFSDGIKYCPGILDVIKNSAKYYEFREIEGGHHLHMDQPELIASLFAEFLKKVQSQ